MALALFGNHVAESVDSLREAVVFDCQCMLFYQLKTL